MREFYTLHMHVDLERTSLHESGHALVYLSQYIPITAWSINKKGNSHGFVEVAHGLPGHLALTNAFAGIAASHTKRPWSAGWETLSIGFDETENDVQQASRIIQGKMARAGLKEIMSHLPLLDHLLREVLRNVRTVFKQDPFPQAIASIACYMRRHEQEKSKGINRRMLNHLRIDDIGRLEKEQIQKILDETKYDDILSPKNIRTCTPKIRRLFDRG